MALILLLAGAACPEEFSREAILRDLAQDRPVLQLRVLTSLPDKSLPQLERHFVERAPHHPWLFGHLLAKYGTAAVLPQVREIYVRDHRRWGCAPRMPFLAYFLRVEGATLPRLALRDRRDTGCFRWVLWEMANLTGPAAAGLEDLAIEFLFDEDFEVARSAAGVLGEYGSPAAEAHLWRALERAQDRNRQYWFWNVIQTAQSWYFDQGRRSRMLQLCRDEECRSGVVGVSARPAVRIQAYQMMYGPPLLEVGWYRPGSLPRLRDKIAQFPRGTVFGWCTEREGAGELHGAQVAKLEQEVRNAVESQGFVFLDDPPHGTCSYDAERTGVVGWFLSLWPW